MGLLSLLNFALVALPIGSTLGVLLGLQAHRDATGQDPIFKPTNPGVPPKNNKITIVHKCNETVGITPASSGDEYTRTYPSPDVVTPRPTPPLSFTALLVMRPVAPRLSRRATSTMGT